MRARLRDRIGAAPISWGVCEVPGWGHRLGADRVLAEMRSLGLSATELGAPGFLPEDSGGLRRTLADHDLRLVGAFVPLVLHDRGKREAALSQARSAAGMLDDHGATRFVTAAVQDEHWSPPRRLDDDGMTILAEGLALVDAICADHGLLQVLHPHVGTLIETRRDIESALAHSDVAWCLDTGHLSIGGLDPVEFARDHGHRVGHVHLKDVRGPLASALSAGRLSLLEAVQAGLFSPLGAGDVDVVGTIEALEAHGYDGWYILEQDCALTDGLPEPGEGPVHDVRRSLEFLTSRFP